MFFRIVLILTFDCVDASYFYLFIYVSEESFAMKNEGELIFVIEFESLNYFRSQTKHY